MKLKSFSFCIIGLCVSFSTFAFPFFQKSYNVTAEKALTLNKSDLSGDDKNLDNNVFKYALKAYACARKRGMDKQEMLTIIDYSKPAVEPRLWVIDLKHLHVKYAELVAHGEKSGDMVGKYFSNQSGSHESSIGTFLTKSTYDGHNGLTLRLEGLEPGINDHAMSRYIVLHGANYVSENRVMREGRIGRSFGCPAIPKRMAKPTINAIKNGTILFAYAPQSSWLKHSAFLHC
ncbi:MAG: hypothetical protein CMF49_07430 [Legionellales bacterium]|nr:hypothetical protein [Legionellales bacterium]|tara:strand:- start:55 stop:750 length:696 start_codon:yes stop_codon:yes gene_type:complete